MIPRCCRKMQEGIEALKIEYPDMKLEETGPRRANSTLWVGNVRGKRNDSCVHVWGYDNIVTIQATRYVMPYTPQLSLVYCMTVSR